MSRRGRDWDKRRLRDLAVIRQREHEATPEHTRSLVPGRILFGRPRPSKADLRRWAEEADAAWRRQREENSK